MPIFSRFTAGIRIGANPHEACASPAGAAIPQRARQKRHTNTHFAARANNAHRYLPAVTPSLAGQSALSRVLDKIFSGSPEMLLTQLVSDRKLSEAEIRRLRKLLDERLAKAREEG